VRDEDDLPALRCARLTGGRLLEAGDFLNGRAAFVYHFLHALWFMTLIDAFWLEQRLAARRRSGNAG
jgi:hypothetical protein